MPTKIKFILCIFLVGIFTFSMTVCAETATKLNVVLVLDISISMKNSTKPYKVEEAVRAFADKIPNNGSMLSIVAFTGGYDVIADKYVFNEENDKYGIEKIINELNEKIDFYKDLNEGLNGTAIANAMKQGDILISDYKNNNEYITAMLVYTDGVDSRSAPDDEQQTVEDFAGGKYGSYPIYVIEMPTVSANANMGERKLELSKLGAKNGGEWIEEINIANIPMRFVSVAEHLTKALFPAQTNEISDETPSPQSDPDVQSTQFIITEIEMSNTPVDKMFNNVELIVQCVLKTGTGNDVLVVGDEEVYNNYNAKFYIKNETDKEYRVTDMEVKGGSYKTRYELPIGTYSFYTRVWQGDKLLLSSADRTITVLSSTPPVDISLEIEPSGTIYQEQLSEEEREVTLTTKLKSEETYNDPLYYASYQVMLLIKHNNNLIDRIPMTVKSMSYGATYKVKNAGEYVFQAELIINDTTGNRLPSTIKIMTYKKALPLPVLCMELLLVLAISVFIFVKRDMYFPRNYFGFLEYKITDFLGNHTAAGTVQLKSHIGRLTLWDVLSSDCENIINTEWFTSIQMKPVSKGISVSVKGNIVSELHTRGKTVQKKTQTLQNNDRLTLIIGDYKAVLGYTTY